MLPENKRICKFFTTNSVEDEFHFVIICPLYLNRRKALFDKLSLNDLPDRNIFIKLMSAKDMSHLLLSVNLLQNV